MFGSYISLSLPTGNSLIILSSVCLHHATGLNRDSSFVLPGPKYGLVLTISVESTLLTVLVSSSQDAGCPIEASYPIVNSSPFLTVSSTFLNATSTPPVPL